MHKSLFFLHHFVRLLYRMAIKMDRQFQTHTFKPVFDENSEILILGTFPSVKSRENNFYYGHPQNRFWRVLAEILKGDVCKTVDEKKQMLLLNHIAVWDVIKSCEISNSADSSIKNVVANDFSEILSKAKIKTVYANGRTAEKLYNKYVKDKTGREIVALPSTSPANAAFGIERLVEEWSIIRKDLSV